MRKTLIPLVLSLLPVTAYAQRTPADIVQAAIQNWRGKSSYMEQRMVVHRPDWERETAMVTITRGEKDALVRFHRAAEGCWKRDSQARQEHVGLHSPAESGHQATGEHDGSSLDGK